MNRRALLRSAGLASALLAGCVGADDPAASPTETSTPTPSPEAPRVTDTAFEVVENTCGTGEDEASIAFESAAVTVTGTISGANTCYTAALHEATVDDGTLTVAVRAYVPETKQGQMCGQCLVDIDYDARVSVDGSPPERVVVTHDRETVAQRER